MMKQSKLKVNLPASSNLFDYIMKSSILLIKTADTYQRFWKIHELSKHCQLTFERLQPVDEDRAIWLKADEVDLESWLLSSMSLLNLTASLFWCTSCYISAVIGMWGNCSLHLLTMLQFPSRPGHSDAHDVIQSPHGFKWGPRRVTLSSVCCVKTNPALGKEHPNASGADNNKRHFSGNALLQMT